MQRKIAQLRKRLHDLYEASMTVKGSPSEILNKLLEKVAGILHPRFILVERREGKDLVYKASHNLPEELKKLGREPVEGSMCGRVLTSGGPLIIRNLQTTSPWRKYKAVRRYDLKTYAGVPLFSHEGKTIGALCLLADEDREFSEEDIKILTLFAQRASAEIEREELVNQLRESEARYRGFFEQASDGMLVVDGEGGRILETNRRFQRLSAYPRDELLGMKIEEFRPPENGSQFDEFTRGLVDGKEAFDDVPIKARGGELFYADIRASALTLSGRKVFQCLVRDITEKKKIRERMIHSERLASLGELAAAVAHEINNPTHTIFAYSHLLLEEVGDDGKKREWLEMMVSEASRVKKIVQGLLEFARRKEPELGQVDVGRVIDSGVALVENQAHIHNVQIERSVAPGLPHVTGDAVQLQQVFMNVALNAIEAMDKGGTFTIDAGTADGDLIEIRFSDTGCGITEENIARLFEPFFSTKPSGTGLGLSVSHGIVTSHGGTIRVESKLNEGTTVVIALPSSRK